MPRIATLTTAVLVAAALALVFTRSGGSSGRHAEVFLQAANSSGQDPFTESTAKNSAAAPLSAAPAASTAPANEVRGVDGGAPGLYSGTKNSASCDVEQQIRYFQGAPDRNRAFASQAGVQPSGVPAYLRSLTPVQLRADTRVTAHGYRDGRTTTYQSVLQAGTAVLVDGHGVPRLRCACGNPLAPPVAQQTTPRTTGAAWPGYRPSNVVVVAPAAQVIKVFVVFDREHDDWFGRRRGDHTGRHDRPVRPPADPNPLHPPASSGPSTPPGSGNGSESPPSNSPSSNTPSAQSPASKPPSAEPQSSAPPSSAPPENESGSPRTESPKNESPASQPPQSRGPAPAPPSSARPPSAPSAGPESAVSSAPAASSAPVASSAQQAPPSPAAPGSPAV